MLNAAVTLAVAFAASAHAASGTPVPAIPSVIVNVRTAPGIPSELVSALLDETDAIWRPTGITFLWRMNQSEPYAGHPTAEAPCDPAPLRVVIGDEIHRGSDSGFRLGWIVFDNPSTPEQDIHVSYRTAILLLERSPGVVGVVESMPPLQRRTLLARALGRALAHELGHYLSASPVHTPDGLMMALHTAAEFFGPGRGRFRLDPAQWRQIVARITSTSVKSSAGA
jgi:hypothetical protein